MVVAVGNIFRGVAVASKGGDRVTGDHMGMLATIINALALATSRASSISTRSCCRRSPCPRSARASRSAQRSNHLSLGPRGDLRRRHRQSVLYDRFCSCLRAAEMGR